MSDAQVIWPDDSRCTDEEVVGGKAASLARLVHLGFSVPEFFVIPSHCSRPDEGVSAALLAEVESACGKLAATAFSVRSSAVGEDSAGASFAGLYQTVLDVARPDLAAAIETCWTSLGDLAAQEYRRRLDDAAEARMAVVVQRMLAPTWSGVCFTANPVSNSLAETVINASTGVGEALVSGSVNPEQITVDNRTGEVTARVRGDQDVTLGAEIVRSIWTTCQEISERIGFPQDVEWAVVGTDLYILQSRPITTIADVYYSRFLEPWKDDSGARPDDPARIWSRAYADEIWAPPVSPLFYNVQNLTPSFISYWRWHHDKTAVPPDSYKYFRAAAYADVDVLQRQYEYHPRFSRIAGIVNFFPADKADVIRQAPWRWRGRLLRTLHFEFQERQVRSLACNNQYLENLWPEFISQSDPWFDMDLGRLSDEELAQHQQEIGATVGKVSPPCGFAVAYHAHDLTFILTGLLDRWFGDGDALYAEVTAGLDDTETVREAEAIWELASLVRESIADPEGAVDTTNLASYLNSLPTESRVRFEQRFDFFWRQHRHRGANYKDLVYRRWGDDPEMLFEIIKGYVASETRRPSDINRETAQRRREVQRDLLARLRGPLARPRRVVLRSLFRYNEIYMRQRDNHRFYFDRVWYELRRIYLEYGRRLAALGVLAVPDDVFFLGTAEIAEAQSGKLAGAAARARITFRRQQWEETRKQQPPKFIRGYTPESAIPARTPSDGTVHTGIGASPGRVQGVARVIYDVEQLSEIADGEILVARQTDPGWTPVFARIAGLVLETGGVLAHGASLCREYGLPCVSTVENALAVIPDGALVELSGSDGTVRVVA